MKLLNAILMLACLCTAAIAADLTYSNVPPEIQRLQGVILFPTDIIVGEVDRAGVTETQYKYKLIRVQDTGQKIHQDRAVWVDKNKSLFDAELYGTMAEVIANISEGKIVDLQTTAATKLTEMKKAVPKLTEKELEKPK